MKQILLAALLCGCLQIQFDEPLSLKIEDASENGEIELSQTFSCNFDVSLFADFSNGTLGLEISEGISALYSKQFLPGDDVQLQASYSRAAPLKVTLLREDFVGDLDFSVSCS